MGAGSGEGPSLAFHMLTAQLDPIFLLDALLTPPVRVHCVPVGFIPFLSPRRSSALLCLWVSLFSFTA